MKPFCRILSSYKNLGCYCTLQSPNLLYLSGSLWNFGRFCSYSNQFLGVQRIIDHGKSEFCHSGSSLDLSRICRRTGLVPSMVGLYRKLCVIRYAVSDVRNCSLTTPTSKVEPCVKFKQFVVDRITKDVGSESGEIIEEKVENDKRESDNFEVRALKREESGIEKDAWRLLQNAVVSYCNSPVGTVAANDPNGKQTLNYDQVFIRDFVPSALAFLMKGEGEIVKNFLIYTMQLQSREKTVDCYSPGQGLMPASFKVRTIPLDGADGKFEEVLDPDFGESAIGRVAPVDSGLWWIILLRAYGKLTGDYSLQERVDVQTGMRLILNLSLTNGFDMFPSLLVTDGSCMIDRRMGFHGHPLEIQALFYSALRCSREMLNENDGSKNLVRAINNRLSALSFHIREYYWVDMKKINEIYRYKTEEYLMDAINKFNIYPGQIPHWLMDWIPEEGGYMIGIFNQLTWILDSSRSGICGALFHHWVLRDRIRLF